MNKDGSLDQDAKDSNVIWLRNKMKAENIYECSCENLSFFVYQDGRIQCARCQTFLDKENTK